MDFSTLREKRKGKSNYLETYNKKINPLVMEIERKLENAMEESRYYEEVKKELEKKLLEDIKRKLGNAIITSEIDSMIDILRGNILERGKSSKRLKVLNNELEFEIRKIHRKEELLLEKEIKELECKIKDEQELEYISELIYSKQFRKMNIR